MNSHDNNTPAKTPISIENLLNPISPNNNMETPASFYDLGIIETFLHPIAAAQTVFAVPQQVDRRPPHMKALDVYKAGQPTAASDRKKYYKKTDPKSLGDTNYSAHDFYEYYRGGINKELGFYTSGDASTSGRTSSIIPKPYNGETLTFSPYGITEPNISEPAGNWASRNNNNTNTRTR